MLHSIAQTVALTNWGNSALRRGLDLQQAGFFPGNTVFNECKSVRFVDADPKTAAGGEADYAADPLEWIKILRESRVQLLRLHYSPSKKEDQSDRIASSVGEGGRWFIEAVKVLASDFWEAHWEKGEGGKASVVYKRVSANESVRPIDFHSSLEEINSRLEKGLKAMAEFARGHGQEKFAKSFEDGAKIAEDSKSPLASVSYPDILYPEHFSLKAKRALGAVQTAWVFGGKGSWNDVRLDDDQDHETYEKFSDEAYTLFCRAIVYATNSGFLKE